MTHDLMTHDLTPEAEVETIRLSALENFRQGITDQGGDIGLIESNFVPGSFGCHEALHLSLVLASTIEREMLQHPAVFSNAAWYEKAFRAQELLAQLYQEISADHFGNNQDQA